MYIALHKRAERIINHSMPTNPVLSIKFVGHDPDIEVPFAFLGTSVPGMQVTLILDEQFDRRKGISKESFDGSGSLAHFDSSLCMCLDSQIDCPMINRKVMPRRPNNLKLTQASSVKL